MRTVCESEKYSEKYSENESENIGIGKVGNAEREKGNFATARSLYLLVYSRS